MRNIKSFLVATCLFLLTKNIHPCKITWQEDDATNPCVKLEKGHQEFFSPTLQKWIKAKDLREQDTLLFKNPLKKDSDQVLCIEKIERQDCEGRDFINLTLTNYHNFCANGILVHNSLAAILSAVLTSQASKVFSDLVSMVLTQVLSCSSGTQEWDKIENLTTVACGQANKTSGISKKEEARIIEQERARESFRSYEEVRARNYKDDTLKRLLDGLSNPAFFLPTNFSITYASPHVLPVIAAGSIMMAGIQLWGIFVSGPQRERERAARSENEWVGVFHQIDILRQQKTNILEEHFVKSRNKAVAQTVVKCTQMVKEAQEKAPMRALEAQAFQEAKAQKGCLKSLEPTGPSGCGTGKSESEEVLPKKHPTCGSKDVKLDQGPIKGCGTGGKKDTQSGPAECGTGKTEIFVKPEPCNDSKMQGFVSTGQSQADEPAIVMPGTPELEPRTPGGKATQGTQVPTAPGEGSVEKPALPGTGNPPSESSPGVSVPAGQVIPARHKPNLPEATPISETAPGVSAPAIKVTEDGLALTNPSEESEAVVNSSTQTKPAWDINRPKKINVKNEAAKAAKIARIAADKDAKRQAWRESQEKRKSISHDQYRKIRTKDIVEQVIPKEGLVVGGKQYSKHALEQVSSDTPNVRTEKEKRKGREAEEKEALLPGTQDYNDYIKKKVVFRNIDLEDVAYVVDNTVPIFEKSKFGTNRKYYGEKITVIQNHDDIIVTVWHSHEKPNPDKDK